MKLFPFEDTPIFRENKRADVAGQPGADSQHEIVKKREGLLAVIVRRHGRVVGMRMIEPDERRPGRVGPTRSDGSITLPSGSVTDCPL